MSAPGTCTITINEPNQFNQSPTILAGNLVRFLASFTDAAGAAADPTTVTFVVGTAYDDEVPLTPVHDSLGHWHADWDTTSAVQATYYCDVTGAGTLQVIAETSVGIRTPKL